MEKENQCLKISFKASHANVHRIKRKTPKKKCLKYEYIEAGCFCDKMSQGYNFSKEVESYSSAIYAAFWTLRSAMYTKQPQITSVDQLHGLFSLFVSLPVVLRMTYHICPL